MTHDLNDRIDQLLREVPFGHQAEDAAEDDLLALAQRMRAVDLSHRSAIRVELRERLQEDKPTMPYGQSIKRVTVAAALALILGVFALLGPGRSMAEEIIGRLGIVSVSTDDPEFDRPGFDPTAPTATPIDSKELANAPLDVTSEEGPYVAATAAEVAEATGVEYVYQPGDVPYPFIGWKAFTDGYMVHISSMWSSTAADGTLEFVSITQMRNWVPFTYEAGPAAVTETRTIGGYEALVITNADLELTDGRLFTIVVIEAGQDTLVVQSPSLDTETVVAIAETLFD